MRIYSNKDILDLEPNYCLSLRGENLHFFAVSDHRYFTLEFKNHEHARTAFRKVKEALKIREFEVTLEDCI